MRVFNAIALTLVVIGALNWGMVGFFNMDIISGALRNVNPLIPRIIFALVGLSGLWALSFYRKCCACCDCHCQNCHKPCKCENCHK